MYRQRMAGDGVIRFRPFTAGEYVVAENDMGVIDTLGRSFTMTVSQIVEQFVIQQDGSAEDWTGVSRATRRMWNAKSYDELVPVIHMIEPRRRPETDRQAITNLDMPFKSCYMEQGAENDELLQEGDTKPSRHMCRAGMSCLVMCTEDHPEWIRSGTSNSCSNSRRERLKPSIRW